MIASELISDNLPSVKSTDSAWTVLGWMSEFKIYQLPIVDDRKFLGLVSEDEILDSADLMLPIGNIRYTSSKEGAYVFEYSHIYEVISTMNSLNLEVLPVLSPEKQYLGIITLRDVVDQLGTLFALEDPGSIIVLEVPQNSFVLSEIGRIAESEHAKVMSFYVSPTRNGKNYKVTLKVNIEETSRLVASFNRFNYNVIHTFTRRELPQNYQRNLDALMNFLDI
ncbi:MAG: CBS domain-containing protein [Bacteroidota bacterium]